MTKTNNTIPEWLSSYLSKTPYKVEGETEDSGFIGLEYVDELCSYCMNETFNIPADRVSLCAHCCAELFPCAGCDVEGCDISESPHSCCKCFSHSDAFVECRNELIDYTRQLIESANGVMEWHPKEFVRPFAEATTSMFCKNCGSKAIRLACTEDGPRLMCKHCGSRAIREEEERV